MTKSLNQIYNQYMQSEEHEATDQSIYDGSKDEALEVLKAILPEGANIFEYQDIVSTVMINAHRQGFLEGFRYGSKIWAELLASK
ncbi:MAG: hypothetical protein ACRKFN_10575 [Desulfitobacterium sp.]